MCDISPVDADKGSTLLRIETLHGSPREGGYMWWEELTAHSVDFWSESWRVLLWAADHRERSVSHVVLAGAQENV